MDKIKKFSTNLEALENLGLEIIHDEATKAGSLGNLSKLLYSDLQKYAQSNTEDTRNNLASSLNRIRKAKAIDRSKIGLIAEIVRKIKNLKPIKKQS
jgi:hypothetical protein